MASSGIRRKVDDLGRVVIPAAIRRSLNIREGDAVEVAVEGERVVLSKPRDACVFCGREDDGLTTYRNRRVCRECLGSLGGLDADARDARAGDGTHRQVATTEPGPPATAPAPPAVELPRDRPVDGDALARRLAAAAARDRSSDGVAPHPQPEDDDAGPRSRIDSPSARRPPHDPESTTAW